MFKKTRWLLIVGLCWACNSNNRENIRLREELSALTRALETNHRTVGVLMDSIDANRSAFTEIKVEGSTFNDFALRVKDITRYIREAQNRIAFLESKLKSLNGADSIYAGYIIRLKHELELNKQELRVIQYQVAKYQNQSKNLMQTVDLQESAILDKIDQLELTTAQTDSLLRKTRFIVAESKMVEAESYFAQARAVEETANRTRLAPKKKRSTRKEALELYKKAVFLGKEEAQEKVDELQRKI